MQPLNIGFSGWRVLCLFNYKEQMYLIVSREAQLSSMNQRKIVTVHECRNWYGHVGETFMLQWKSRETFYWDYSFLYIYKLKIYLHIPNKKNYIQTKTKLICKDNFIEIQRNSVTFSTVFEKRINPN
jgi:hypothetical protein